MRRLFLYVSVGVLSLGGLTGCSLFRGSDTNSGKYQVAAASQCYLPCQNGPPVQTAQTTPVAATKSETKTAVPVPTEAKSSPVAVKPVVPPPPPPTPLPLPVPPPIPRLPGANELPVLPPPPWKTSTNDGPLPVDKIVVISNLQPRSAKPDIRDLIDVTEPRNTTVPEARQGQTISGKEGQIVFGHAADFTIVTGQVQVYRQTLRLRYAAIDQNDIFGGVVRLEGGIDLSLLREGKHVRVRGVLIPPAERNESARYRVTAVEFLD